MANEHKTGAFTLAEAARWIGVSRPVMIGWTKRADFPAFKSGRRWVIPRDALACWMAERAKERAQL